MRRSQELAWGAGVAVVALLVGSAVPFLADRLPSFGSLWLPFLLLATAGTLGAQFAIGLRIRGALGALLVMLATYWTLGFLARPLVLLWVQPRPRLNDSLADDRVAGQYAAAITDVLERALPGFILLLFVTLLLRRFFSRDVVERPLLTVRPGHGWVLLLLCWPIRAYLKLTGAESTLLTTFTYLPTIAAGLILIYAPNLRRRTVVGLLLSEGLWSLFAATKAPIMAMLLFGLIRFFLRGGRLRPRLLVGYAVVGLGMFFAVQQAKERSGRLTSTDQVQMYYPALIQPLYPILARFDALQANLDAEFSGPHSYFTVGEVMSRMWQSLLPQQLLGAKFEAAGATWGSIVRPQAFGPPKAGANLAEGPIAEGWVLAGWTGIAVEVLFLAVVIVLVARCFRGKSLLVVAFAVAMTAQPFLFERGMLGIVEGIGKSLQLAVIATIVLALPRAFDRLASSARGSSLRDQRHAGHGVSWGRRGAGGRESRLTGGTQRPAGAVD